MYIYIEKMQISQHGRYPAHSFFFGSKRRDRHRRNMFTFSKKNRMNSFWKLLNKIKGTYKSYDN